MTENLNHLKWAGWGVVNVESLDKQQRRVYLKKVRGELAAVDWSLHPGGTTKTPWYQACGPDKKGQVFAGEDAFQKVCGHVLTQLGEIKEG